MSYRNPGAAFSPAKVILIGHYEEKLIVCADETMSVARQRNL